MASAAAGPSSIKEPKPVLLLVTAARVAVPVLIILPLTRGLLAVGRTRRFCQVSEQVTAVLLEFVTVNVIWALVREVMPTEVPLATPLMLLALVPLPVRRVTKTVGAVPPVSKMKPLGALRMMVPVPTSAVAAS